MTKPRTGPTPLPLHLGLAGANAPDKVEAILRGIKAYQTHPYQRGKLGLPEFWREGQVSLSGARDINRVAVPSFINRSTILDIHGQRSFVRALEANLLDWGVSIEDPAQNDLETLIKERLFPALEQAGKPVHAIGYCLGGTLLLSAAALNPRLFASLTLIAAPWDFHAGDQSMRLLVQSLSPGAFGMMAAQNRLPGIWTQSLFAALDPAKTARKFEAFGDMDQGSPKAEIFVAVEDWLNDPVDLPSAIARTCIQDFYFLNKLKQETDLHKIECPVLVVTGKKDKLVPPESSQALLSVLKNAQGLEVDFGHIGLLASNNAPQQIWAPIQKWIETHSE